MATRFMSMTTMTWSAAQEGSMGTWKTKTSTCWCSTCSPWGGCVTSGVWRSDGGGRQSGLDYICIFESIGIIKPWKHSTQVTVVIQFLYAKYGLQPPRDHADSISICSRGVTSTIVQIVFILPIFEYTIGLRNDWLSQSMIMSTQSRSYSCT